MNEQNEEPKPRNQQVSVIIERGNHVWLWRERRRRDRSIAWLVNQAISQYRDRLEKGRQKADKEQ